MILSAYEGKYRYSEDALTVEPCVMRVWDDEIWGGKGAGEAQIATPRSSTGSGTPWQEGCICPLGSSCASATSQPLTLGQASSVLQYLFPPLGGGEGTGGS